MIESLQLYFNAFYHFNLDNCNKSQRQLSYLELLGISWALHLIHALYSVFALYLGLKSYVYLSGSRNFAHLTLESLSFKFQKFSILTILFSVIFYPFLFQFAYRFWKGLFKFYANIFDYEDEQLQEKADEILKNAFSANLFLIIPIIGNVLSNFALAFFLFHGVKKKYEFTSLQSGLILITPLFIFFLFSIFSASYFLFLFTLI